MNMKQMALGIIALSGLTMIGIRVHLYQHNQQRLRQIRQNQDIFEEFIYRIHSETPYYVYITSSYRSTEKQRELYKQNSKNAKPGTSPHEFRRAIDINLIGINGRIRKWHSKEIWKKTGIPTIAEEMGFRWGGNFKNYHDPVHFEVRQPG